MSGSLIYDLLHNNWESAEQRLQESPQDLRTSYPSDAPLIVTPLEGAIQAGAPTGLILALLQAYPKAAMLENSYTGFKPLFTACSYGADKNVFSALLVAHPDVLNETRRCRLRTGDPRKIVKWSTWKHCEDHKDRVLTLLKKDVSYWFDRAQRGGMMQAGYVYL